MIWIWQNKEWIFSGIGVFAIAAIIPLLCRRRLKPDLAEPQTQQPENVQQSASTTNQQAIQDILMDISSRPSYQQDQAKENYLGLRVQFAGQFEFLSKEENDEIRVWVKDPTNKYLSIIFTVNINDFPEFKTMHRGTALTIEGALKKIDWMTTELTAIKIINK